MVFARCLISEFVFGATQSSSAELTELGDGISGAGVWTGNSKYLNLVWLLTAYSVVAIKRQHDAESLGSISVCADRRRRWAAGGSRQSHIPHHVPEPRAERPGAHDRIIARRCQLVRDLRVGLAIGRIVGETGQGHGRTVDTDRPKSVTAMQVNIAALLDYLKLPKADLIGRSFGDDWLATRVRFKRAPDRRVRHARTRKSRI